MVPAILRKLKRREEQEMEYGNLLNFLLLHKI